HSRQTAFEPAVRARCAADHRRSLAGRVSLLSSGGIRLRHPGPAQEHRGMARPRQSAARLEASLRLDAGASAAGPISHVSPAGLTMQVGFIRLAHLKCPKSGKPDFGWSICFARRLVAKWMDCTQLGLARVAQYYPPQVG